MNITFIYLLGIGLLIINTIIITGSFLSKKFDFDFKKLGFLSLIFYVAIGYFGTVYIDQISGITLSGLVGLYEAIFSIRIMYKLGARIDTFVDDVLDVLDENKNPHPALVIIVVVMYIFLGWLGSLIA